MIHGKSWHGAHTQQWWDAGAETGCSCTWSSCGKDPVRDLCQPKGGRHLRTSTQDLPLTSIDAHLHPHKNAQAVLVIHRCTTTSAQEYVESWLGFVFVGLVSSGGVCFVWGKIGPAGPQTCHFLASTSTETFKYGPSCPARVTVAGFDIWCWSTSLLSVCLCACLSYRLLVYKALAICIRLFWSHHNAKIIVACIYFLLAEAQRVSPHSGM